MINLMRHMGNSGKLAVVAAFVSLGLLVLAAVVLEELVLYLFLGAVLVCYLASLVQVFSRRRYLVVLLGAAGTSLFIGCSIAFLRMWGIAFNQDANALGGAALGSAGQFREHPGFGHLLLLGRGCRNRNAGGAVPRSGSSVVWFTGCCSSPTTCDSSQADGVSPQTRDLPTGCSGQAPSCPDATPVEHCQGLVHQTSHNTPDACSASQASDVERFHPTQTGPQALETPSR